MRARIFTFVFVLSRLRCAVDFPAHTLGRGQNSRAVFSFILVQCVRCAVRITATVLLVGMVVSLLVWCVLCGISGFGP